MIINRKLVVQLLVGGLMVFNLNAPARGTGILVFDALADGIRVAMAALQEKEYAEMLLQVQRQTETLTQLFSETDIHEFILSEAWKKLRREVPTEYQEALDVLVNGGEGDFYKYINEKVEKYAAVDGEVLYENAAFQDVYNDKRNIAMYTDSAATRVLDQSNARLSRSEELISKLGTKISTAEKLDLLAAISAETLINQNELIKLQAMQLKQQAMALHEENLNIANNVINSGYQASYLEASNSSEPLDIQE